MGMVGKIDVRGISTASVLLAEFTAESPVVRDAHNLQAPAGPHFLQGVRPSHDSLTILR